MKSIDKFLVGENETIKKAMHKMSDIGQKALFVTDGNKRLIGSLSDGDIRRWILSGGSISEKIRCISNKNPKFVDGNYSINEVKRIMLSLLIESIPVVEKNGKILDVLTWGDVFAENQPIQRKKIKRPVVIMAGGKGTRLEPFTAVLPKALIPINDKPIIEIIMDKLMEYGIDQFFLSVNHKAKMIKSYFDDFIHKYNIRYIEEKEPLGTVGSLGLLRSSIKGSFIVTNCDTIILSDYAEIIDFHEQNKYDMTLVVSCRQYVIPYGVCIIENTGRLKKIDEKPVCDLLVNTGMYVMQNSVLSLIPKNRMFNINDLIKLLPKKGLKIGVYPISDNAWIDVGQWDEYRKAIEKMRAN